MMCSREPGVQALMWFATGGMNIGTPSGPNEPFICWDDTDSPRCEPSSE